ncbi:uncharacterized protein MELLADRAFT_86947 [Melampsora larici-populina 98AG31]|uniref:Secreted protein n=1 Tax=Melampsora larici-populina (strain 98AG31 / pathotype 3-4-7) TaxID=747676 RepID=F4R3Y7_MELLP|nr:uncharacterized protein MELLADRAFT_86947 [Melampsora larici-populina 98AG31]EGG12704.1 secreted protein [Melampsora larici-populina 98AG31]
MLFFKVVIAAVLAATIPASLVQVGQPVTRDVLQRRFVEFTPIIEKRFLLKTCDSDPGPHPNNPPPHKAPSDEPPTCNPCEGGGGCC